MLFEVMNVILAIMLPCFFLFGFSVGARKSQDPSAPIIPKKPKKKKPDKLEILARNIANYSGDSSNQEKIS